MPGYGTFKRSHTYDRLTQSSSFCVGVMGSMSQLLQLGPWPGELTGPAGGDSTFPKSLSL